MKKIIINGGRKLQGEVTISGAKNSAVALIPAAPTVPVNAETATAATADGRLAVCCEHDY